MDGDPGYTSEVMTAFSSLLGVKHRDVSAPDNPTHHSMVERRNRVMEKFIDVGSSKGDIKASEDLDMYCAAATAACNLEYIYHDHTVMEYLTGEVPRTHRDMVRPADVPDILGDIDDEFLEQLRSLLLEQNNLVTILRDDDARYSAMGRDTASSRQHVTQFTLRPGDRVSYTYDSQEYTLLSIGDSTPTTPAKAVIRLVSHEHVATRTVRYASLRPLASPRPELMRSSVTCDGQVMV